MRKDLSGKRTGKRAGGRGGGGGGEEREAVRKEEGGRNEGRGGGGGRRSSRGRGLGCRNRENTCIKEIREEKKSLENGKNEGEKRGDVMRVIDFGLIEKTKEKK